MTQYYFFFLQWLLQTRTNKFTCNQPLISEQLEKQRKRETDIRRAQSAIVRPGERFARSQMSRSVVEPGQGQKTRPETAPTHVSDLPLNKNAGGNSTVVYQSSPSPTSVAFQGNQKYLNQLYS